MKATEQFFSCGAVYYVVQYWYWILNRWIISWNVTIQIKATEQYFSKLLYYAQRFNIGYTIILGVRKISCTLSFKCLHLQMNGSHKRIKSGWQDDEDNGND